jgi:hypothetical protein
MVLVRTEVSEERTTSIIMVTRIGDLGTLAMFSNRNTQEPHGVTSQKTAFFIVTAVKNSNLTKLPEYALNFAKCFPLHTGATAEANR